MRSAVGIVEQYLAAVARISDQYYEKIETIGLGPRRGKRIQPGVPTPGSGDYWGGVPLKMAPDPSDLPRQQQNRKRQTDTANCQTLRYLYGQNLPAAIIPAGRARGMATDSATALRTLGQLRGVPAIGGFSRPKSHLGRFSFRYTHWLILLS